MATSAAIGALEGRTPDQADEDARAYMDRQLAGKEAGA
jgi:hypothetical protein